MNNINNKNDDTPIYGGLLTVIMVVIALVLSLVKGNAEPAKSLGLFVATLLIPTLSSIGNGFFNRKRQGGFRYSFHWFFFYSSLAIFALHIVINFIKLA